MYTTVRDAREAVHTQRWHVMVEKQIIVVPTGARHKKENTMLPILVSRIVLPAHHSRFPGLDALHVLVPYKYDHIHVRQCGVGAPYTSRKCPPSQLLWRA